MSRIADGARDALRPEPEEGSFFASLARFQRVIAVMFSREICKISYVIGRIGTACCTIGYTPRIQPCPRTIYSDRDVHHFVCAIGNHPTVRSQCNKQAGPKRLTVERT
ncbi:hypothetical protein [Sphingobium sp. AP50]|uniref:hypothetical protein n=1 Tax=Sphingobium sp. AP50 TaxID=1884369 RepID=UPI001160C2AB|nr:hypothetical protein [Sphingobium sp. AP50]